jgi:aquaporin Z
MKKYLIEFLGTLFLVLAIGLTKDPLAIGLTLAAMVYIGGHVSGAHYNPAISIAMLIRGKIEFKEFLGYITSQLLGGVVGTLAVLYQGNTFLPSPALDSTLKQAYMIEIMLTFVLVSVVLTVATAKKLKGNFIYGFAIGLTLTGIAFIGAPISGAVFNPAVAFGPIILSGWYSPTGIWLYNLGPLAGGILAAIVFKIANPKG